MSRVVGQPDCHKYHVESCVKSPYYSLQLGSIEDKPMPKFAIIDAPSNLGLRALGVEKLPAALKDGGLLDGLNAQVTGAIEIPAHDLIRDSETSVLHQNGVAIVAQRLADKVGKVLDDGFFPLVSGGDCSIELGNMLALRRRGRYGLFFLDGHADFYSPESEETGEVASMDLAIVTGRGPESLTNIDGLKPYVRDEDVALFGFRDIDIYLEDSSPDVRATAIHCYDMKTIRQLGLTEAVSDALAHPNQFWIHLDADVLDDADMPAVDYRLPNPGLRLAELSEVLRLLLASGRAVGLSITILNPLLDPDSSITRAFVAALLDGLRSS
jgi:arginase